MTVSIKEIIKYCDVDNENEENHFYFNIEDYQIYSREKMKFEFGYEDSFLNDTFNLRYIYHFIPVFQVCVCSKIRDFLLQENNKKITKSIKNMNESEVGGIFQKLYDYNYGFGHRWAKYIKKYKIEMAIQWCKENNIQYKNDV